MYKIDLLKGEGIPIKARPAGIAVVVIGALLPIILGAVVMSDYFGNRIAITVKQWEVNVYQRKIEHLSEAVRIQERFEKEKASVNESVSELDIAINRYTQWSPIVQTVAENIPGSIILTQFEGKQHFIKPKPGQKNKDKKGPTVSRELKMSVSGMNQSTSDKDVREFRNSLRASDVLKSRVQDIPVSQKFDKFEGLDVVSYKVNVLFKPGM